MSLIPPEQYLETAMLATVRRAVIAVAVLWVLLEAAWAAVALIGSSDVAALAVVLASLALQITTYLWAAVRPGIRAGLLALAGGTVAVVTVPAALAGVRPDLVDSSGLPLAASAMMLCALGPVTGGALGGIRWCLSGLALAVAGEVIVRLVLDLPIAVAIEPVIVTVVYLSSLIALHGRGRARRRRRRAEVALMERTLLDRDARIADERATALIHDTLLGDLAALAAWNGPLPAEYRERMEADAARAVRVIERPMVAGAEGEGPDAGAAEPPSTAELAVADDFRAMLREVQWTGLAVSLSGEPASLAAVGPEPRAELLLAVRAALDNVRNHAGTNEADLSISLDGSSLLVTVSDDGRGFDLHEVSTDRLGLRTAIGGRLEHVGGTASVWSTPGIGTTVLLRVPRTALRAEPSHES